MLERLLSMHCWKGSITTPTVPSNSCVTKFATNHTLDCEGRNVFFTVSDEGQQVKFDLVIANVARMAQLSRENSVDLVIELMTGAAGQAERRDVFASNLKSAIPRPRCAPDPGKRSVLSTGCLGILPQAGEIWRGEPWSHTRRR